MLSEVPISNTPKQGLPVISLTIDTEWWGRAHLVSGEIPDKDGLEKDIEAIFRLLDLLDELEIPATFFVVARDFPQQVVGEITGRGHEVASHSVSHPHFGRIPLSEWKSEIIDSKAMLEDYTGQAVYGFRTPSWSVPYDQRETFHEMLLQAGYRYDSSFCAFETWLYGDKRFEQKPFESEKGIFEIPVPLIGFPKAPWIGGFYFRLMPYPVLKQMISQSSPAFLYVHPWEFYPANISGMNLRDRIITNYGRRHNLNKLRRLLLDLKSKRRFCTMSTQTPG